MPDLGMQLFLPGFNVLGWLPTFLGCCYPGPSSSCKHKYSCLFKYCQQMHFNNTTQATTRSSLIKVSSLVCYVVLSGNTRYLLTTKIKPVSQTYSVYIRNLLLFATEQKILYNQKSGFIWKWAVWCFINLFFTHGKKIKIHVL